MLLLELKDTLDARRRARSGAGLTRRAGNPGGPRPCRGTTFLLPACLGVISNEPRESLARRKPTMSWMRLNPALVIRQLRAEHGLGDEDAARQALAHLRTALLSGEYVAVENDEGHTFIGTEAEAVDHMMAHSGH